MIKKEITHWINYNLQKLIDYKQKLLNQQRKNRTDIDLKNRLKRIGCVIKKAYKESMNNYYKDNLDAYKQDSRKSWNFINKALGRDPKRTISLKDTNGEFITCDSRRVEALNNYFLQSVKEPNSADFYRFI